MTKDQVVEAVRARGSNARDLRDAVHEAYHAVSVGAEDWDRDALMDVLARKYSRANRSEALLNELEARAAEWAACDVNGVEYDVRHWVATMCMEAVKFDRLSLPFEQVVSAVTDIRRRDGDRLYQMVISALEAK